mmetsp:Transcript_21397/g.20572  ORF Transcript_21397/g.20572 Transcript_21397/m.20572 type:complete len:122 (-) Transcript_21397:941-1306(-)
MRVHLKTNIISNRWKWGITVALAVGLVSFPVKYMRLPEKRIINAMFNISELSEQKDKEYWEDPDIGLNLIAYCVLKFFVTILSMSPPIPAGSFIPLFTLGAGIGRTYGYFLKNLGMMINYP